MKINTDPKYKFYYHQYANNDFTFALLDGDRYLTTPFMCKDYFQDIFYAEYTGKSGDVCGMVWEKGKFELTPRMRMAVYGGKDEMASRAANLQAFINAFDVAQGIDPTTVLVTDDPKLVVVEFSKDWTVSGPMISALTTLIRVAGMYTQGQDMVEYLKSMARPLFDKSYKKQWDPTFAYMTVEVQRLWTPQDHEHSTLPKLLALLKGKKSKAKWADMKSMSHAHGFGIMYDTEFPREDVKI